MRVFRGALVLIVPALTTGSVLPEPDIGTAFMDVNVVPMTADVVVPHQTVFVRGGRIEAIGSAGSFALPAGTRVINGSGKYLMPGLVDMHIHVRDTTDLTLYVAKGVTTVRVLRGAPRHLRWRAATAAGQMFGPTLYSSGPFTNLPGVRTPQDAWRAALEQKAAGYDFIKIHGTFERETYDTLVAVGRRLGIPVVGHAPRNLPFEAVLSTRQTEISHLEEFIYTYFARKTGDTEVHRIPQLAGALRSRGIAVTTTLVAYDRIGRQVDSLESLLSEESHRFVSPGQRASWERENNDYVLRFSKDEVPVLRERLHFQLKLLKVFLDSGVTVMAGTDAVGETWVPGWTLHEELENFARAGLTPFQALRAATAAPAHFLDSLRTFGTVEPGTRADLVLLAGNPLSNVSNAARIEGVMLRGKWHSRSELDARLEAVAAQHRKSEARIATLLKGGLYRAAIATCDSDVAFSADEQLLVSLRLTSGTTALAIRGDVTAAQNFADSVRARCPEIVVFDESKLNAAGADLRRGGELLKSIAVYEISERQFPGSFLAPYFLGEALLQKGDTASALAAYRRSVANDAQMMDAIERIQQLTGMKQ